jgi:hypothetical protein
VFRLIALAAHCLPTQSAYFDSTVIEMMNKELNPQAVITNNVVELQLPIHQTIDREAA